MYRRHLRMVLAKDVELNNPKSEFLHRIASIPVVYLAWNIAAGTYNTIKSSNSLLEASLNSTEKAAYSFSKPVLRKFEKQLRSADYIACKGLQKLQDIVPSIVHQRKKIYQQTKSIYDDTVESGLRKYEIVKQVGTSKFTEFLNLGNERFEEFLASPYGEVYGVALAFALEVGEMYVDYYLPSLGDERPEKLFGDRGKEPVSTRVELLRNRFKERFYKHALLKIQLVRLRTKFFVIKVYRFNLYKYVVETSALLPELLFSTITLVFTSLQGVIFYIMQLIQTYREYQTSL